MYVCAGTGSDELWFNDLHRLNVDSLEWREVEQRGNPPSPRDYSTLVTIRDWVNNCLTGLFSLSFLLPSLTLSLSPFPSLSSFSSYMLFFPSSPPPPLLPNPQYLVLYGGSSAMEGSEVVFSDLHYIDITKGSLSL